MVPKKNQQESGFKFYSENHHLGSSMPLESPRDDQVGRVVVGGQEIRVHTQL